MGAATYSFPGQFHRLFKKPLDDMETFSNTKDLYEYCQRGAAYDGQRVAVNFETHTQDYTIRNKIPIIDLYNFEWIVKEYSGKKYVLVMYHNDADSGFKSGLVSYNRLDDPYKFAFLDSIDSFRKKDGTFEFLLEVISYGAIDSDNNSQMNSTIKMITQDFNPIFEAKTSTSNTYLIASPNNSDHIMVCNGLTPAVTMRTKGVNDIHKIWVEATDYLTAMGR